MHEVTDFPIAKSDTDIIISLLGKLASVDVDEDF